MNLRQYLKTIEEPHFPQLLRADFNLQPRAFTRRKFIWVSGATTLVSLAGWGADLKDGYDATGLFSRSNLVAWCIVPFDAKKRGPEERARMLKNLGFTQLAYDWRAEHIPTFDAEIEALKKYGIKLTAFWFPGVLNSEAQTILELLKRHGVTTQLWITMSDPAPQSSDSKDKVEAGVKAVRPIADAAAKIGCQVALYNHGGWFGEPENQIAILKRLNLAHVGLVYNLHHGHDHLDRFPEIFAKMKPYLFAFNLNGMVKKGDQMGQKILPLGQGNLDLDLLRTLQKSGWQGPVGILNHTDEDAEVRLQDNLDGLKWLLPQLEGKPAGSQPKPRSWIRVAAPTGLKTDQ